MPTLNQFMVSTSGVRLSPDLNSWGEQIMSQLLKTYPSMSKIVGEVIITKIDSIKGNAIGYVTLIGRPQRVPFIIDEYHLNPLDVYIDNNRHLPLTERSSNDLTIRRWPFRMISQEERNSILKTAAFGQIEKLLCVVKENPTLASDHPESVDFFMKSACQREVAPVSDFVVRCFVKTAADNKPIVVRDLLSKDAEYSISEFAEKFGKEFTQKVLTDKECVVSTLPPSVTLALDKLELNSVYKPTKDRDGVYIHGSEPIAAHRYDLHRFSDMKRSSSTPDAFITKCGRLFTKGELRRSDRDQSDATTKHVSLAPNNGDYAIAIIGDQAFGPVLITSITRMGADKLYGFVSDDGRDCIMRTSPDVKTLIKLDEGKYLVSEHGVRITKVFPTKAESLECSMLLKKYASKQVVVSLNTSKKFKVDDAGLSGIDINTLSAGLGKSDAIVALMKCGLSENDAKYAIMKTLESGSFAFPVEPKQQEESPKQDQQEQQKLEKKAAEIVKLAKECNLVKIANISGDKSNVDMALGINMVTARDIKRFKLIVPDIYVMLDKLCMLLMMKRRNRNIFSSIDEQNLMSAITSLDEIIFSLSAV